MSAINLLGEALLQSRAMNARLQDEINDLRRNIDRLKRIVSAAEQLPNAASSCEECAHRMEAYNDYKDNDSWVEPDKAPQDCLNTTLHKLPSQRRQGEFYTAGERGSTTSIIDQSNPRFFLHNSPNQLHFLQPFDDPKPNTHAPGNHTMSPIEASQPKPQITFPFRERSGNLRYVPQSDLPESSNPYHRPSRPLRGDPSMLPSISDKPTTFGEAHTQMSLPHERRPEAPGNSLCVMPSRSAQPATCSLPPSSAPKEYHLFPPRESLKSSTPSQEAPKEKEETEMMRLIRERLPHQIYQQDAQNAQKALALRLAQDELTAMFPGHFTPTPTHSAGHNMSNLVSPSRFGITPSVRRSRWAPIEAFNSAGTTTTLTPEATQTEMTSGPAHKKFKQEDGKNDEKPKATLPLSSSSPRRRPIFVSEAPTLSRTRRVSEIRRTSSLGHILATVEDRFEDIELCDSESPESEDWEIVKYF